MPMTPHNRSRQNLTTELIAELRDLAADYTTYAGNRMMRAVHGNNAPSYTWQLAREAAHYGRLALVFRDAAHQLEQDEHNLARYRELVCHLWDEAAKFPWQACNVVRDPIHQHSTGRDIVLHINAKVPSKEQMEKLAGEFTRAFTGYRFPNQPIIPRKPAVFDDRALLTPATAWQRFCQWRSRRHKRLMVKWEFKAL
jgi:hypothetical protein